jgi:hypothetical protein
VPVRAILAAALFNMLFGLLYLGPTVAFNAYCASCTIFLNMSYAIPVAILLLRGRVEVTKSSPTGGRPVFYLGHTTGYVMNVIAVLFVFVTSIFFRFPGSVPVSTNTMNYVTAVLGIFGFFGTGLWFAKKGKYKGPQFEIILAQDILAQEEANAHRKEMNLEHVEVA